MALATGRERGGPVSTTGGAWRTGRRRTTPRSAGNSFLGCGCFLGLCLLVGACVLYSC